MLHFTLNENFDPFYVDLFSYSHDQIISTAIFCDELNDEKLHGIERTTVKLTRHVELKSVYWTQCGED